MTLPTRRRRVWRGRLDRALAADALAEASGGGGDEIARLKVAHVGLDGANTACYELQEGRRVVEIEGRDLGVVRRRDEEAETEDEGEDKLADATKGLHVRARPHDHVEYQRHRRLEPAERSGPVSTLIF